MEVSHVSFWHLCSLSSDTLLLVQASCFVTAEGQGCCKEPHKEAEEQGTLSPPLPSPACLPQQQRCSKEDEERRAAESC